METIKPKTKMSLRWQFDNPITRKELRSRMRGGRAFIILTLYLLILSLFITLFYTAISQQSSVESIRTSGRAIFTIIILVQFFLATMTSSAFTSNAISSERERQTLDLLRTTLLSGRSIVNGKLASGLGYVLLLIAASLPLHGLALMLGGIDLSEFLISQVVMTLTAFFFALWGLYASTKMKTTFGATSFSQVGVIGMILILPIIAFSTFSLWGISYLNVEGAQTAFLAYVALLAAATHPFISLVISDIMYLQNGSIWYTTEMIGGYPPTQKIYIFSTWWMTILFLLLGSFFLYSRCIKNVEKVRDN